MIYGLVARAPRAFRTRNISRAEASEHAARYSSPGPKLPVRSLKMPNRYGPRNPPKFPNELIRPRLAAAAALPRKTFGKGQNPGCEE